MVEAKDPHHAKRLADSLATTVRTVSLPETLPAALTAGALCQCGAQCLVR
jgi:hypothetical protein